MKLRIRNIHITEIGKNREKNMTIDANIMLLYFIS